MEELSIRRSAIGTASGSLDLFGGFAKAAGSLAIQVLTEPKVTVLLTEISDPSLRISSTRRGRVSLSMLDFRSLVLGKANPPALVDWLDSVDAPIWSRHVVGCLYLYCQQRNWLPTEGISFAIASDIPDKNGFGSGIALKIACIRSMDTLTSNYSSPQSTEAFIATVDQQVLNTPYDSSVAIAATQNKPCSLLPVNAREEGIAQPPIELPKGLTFFYWSTESKSPRSNFWYFKNSLSAAMGRQIALPAGTESPEGWLPHPTLAEETVSSTVPDQMTGGQYRERHGAIEAFNLKLNPDEDYAPRQAFDFSVRENQRSRLALHLLSSMVYRCRRQTMQHFGELLWESHFDAVTCGLSAPETLDTLRALLQAGPGKGIYGGRVNWIGEVPASLALIDTKATAYLRQLVKETCPEASVPARIA